LQVGFAVPLRQIKEVEQLAVFEDADRVLGQNSHRRCEFLVGQNCSLEGHGLYLEDKLALAPL
jgi:hypothetical protein